MFDGGADCIQECYKGFELGEGIQENEENIINEAFPKIDEMEKS